LNDKDSAIASNTTVHNTTVKTAEPTFSTLSGTG
jgi:hypothetical protein